MVSPSLKMVIVQTLMLELLLVVVSECLSLGEEVENTNVDQG
jgi:hypothetical protein